MSEWLRRTLRATLVVGGAAVVVVALRAVRIEDWPIYLTYLLIAGVSFGKYVEVLPRLALAVPEMATTIGFLYVGGLPIVVVRLFAPLVGRGIDRLLPERWTSPSDGATDRPSPRRTFIALNWGVGGRAGNVTEWAGDMLAFGTRWGVVTAFGVDTPPVSNALAIAVAELAGYACWGLLAILPVYGHGTLLPLSRGGSYRAALNDMGLIVMLALTPFVFLITYGFEAHGLPGAAAWACAALGLHVMLKRLSERRQQVEEQNRSLEKLNRELEHRERLSAIGKMSSVVSHQILHQLGVIGLYADLIRNAETGDSDTALEQTRANATAIEGALRDVNRVLTDLLVFSKDLRLNLYRHPLETIVEEAVAAARPLATEKGVALRHTGATSMEISVDKLKISQAVGNVIGNAIDMSPAGSEIEVDTRVRDGMAEILVTDQGPGVAAADREAIFTPFYTTKEQGTGLGLAIAREFTEAHGGRLWVEDPPGRRGARFVFAIPTQSARNAG
jgi:signal transduction histidine kinase